MLTGKCSLVKGVTKQTLLPLSSMLRREKQATRRFLRAAGLVGRWLVSKCQIHRCLDPLFDENFSVKKEPKNQQLFDKKAPF